MCKKRSTSAFEEYELRRSSWYIYARVCTTCDVPYVYAVDTRVDAQ